MYVQHLPINYSEIINACNNADVKLWNIKEKCKNDDAIIRITVQFKITVIEK